MTIKFIGCGNLSLYHIHPLLSSVFFIIRAYAFLELKNNYKSGLNKNEKKWENNDPVFLTLIMFLGESVGGIYDLIETNCNKKKHSIKTRKESVIKYAKRKISVIQMKKSNTVQILLMIFGITVIEFICFYFLQYFSLTHENSTNLQTEIRSFKLIFDSLSCYLVLHIRVYKHHYLSIIILILGITLVTIEDFTNGNSFEWYLVIVFFGHSFLISIRDICEKWIIDNKFVSAVRSLFIRGVFGSLIGLLIGVCGLTWKGKISIFESFSQIFTSSGLAIFLFIVYFIGCFLYNFFYSLTKQYFYPTHTVVSDSFSTVMWMIILELLPSGNQRNWIYLGIGSIFVVFGCLVYNDIIILYFWGLEQNTKFEVTRRSINDSSFSIEMINIENEDNDVNDYNGDESFDSTL